MAFPNDNTRSSCAGEPVVALMQRTLVHPLPPTHTRCCPRIAISCTTMSANNRSTPCLRLTVRRFWQPNLAQMLLADRSHCSVAPVQTKYVVAQTILRQGALDNTALYHVAACRAKHLQPMETIVHAATRYRRVLWIRWDGNG